MFINKIYEFIKSYLFNQTDSFYHEDLVDIYHNKKN
jgi:hypothetical protein